MSSKPVPRYSALKTAVSARLAVFVIVWAVMVLAMVTVMPSAYAEQAPTDVVKSLVNPALQILGDKSIALKDRQQKLRQLVSGDVFDYTAMARSALGLHWKDLNDQQHQDFTQVFTAFLRDSYISRIQDYSGDQVKVNFLGPTDLDAGRSEVKTTIEQPDGKQPIQVNYALRQDGGKWLIYDVTVDNISIAANYRNQFNRVINNQGFDTLLGDLKSKQQGLEDRLGTSHSQN